MRALWSRGTRAGGPSFKFIAAGALLVASCGVAGAEPDLPPAAPVVSATVPSRSQHRLRLSYWGDQPRPATIRAARATPSPPPHHRPGQPVRIMFIGDSVASTTAEGLAAIAADYGAVVQNDGIMGCGVVTDGPYRYFGTQYPSVLPQCGTWAASWSASVHRDNPDVAAIVVGRWELMDRFWQGRWTHVGDPAYDAYLLALYDRAVSIAGAGGARIALFTSPYYLRGRRPDGGLWPEDDPSRVDAMNGLFRQLAARHPTAVTLVDFGGRLSPGGRMAMSIDGVAVRSDGVHIALDAGPWLAPWLLPQLVRLGA